LDCLDLQVCINVLVLLQGNIYNLVEETDQYVPLLSFLFLLLLNGLPRNPVSSVRQTTAVFLLH
jgi:hypothetical protein